MGRRSAAAAALRCAALLAAAAAALASPAAAAAAAAPAAAVVALTDLNFDSLVNATGPPWMVDVHVPWCPACRALDPVWRQLAADLAPDGVRVGSVDGTREAGLLRRLKVRHFPSIYHIAGRETREYAAAARDAGALAAYARGGWTATRPRTGCASVTSRCGRAVGAAASLPATARARYRHLQETRRLSDVTLFAGMLAVPVTLGLAVICLLDALNTRRGAAGGGGERGGDDDHEHFD
jgi:hypothetical protein